MAGLQNILEIFFLKCLLTDLQPAFKGLLSVLFRRFMLHLHHLREAIGAALVGSTLDGGLALSAVGRGRLSEILLHSCRLTPILRDTILVQPLLPLQVFDDPLLGQLSQRYGRFLPLSIRLHLLDVCFLFHPTLRIIFSFLFQAFLDG